MGETPPPPPRIEQRGGLRHHQVQVRALVAQGAQRHPDLVAMIRGERREHMPTARIDLPPVALHRPGCGVHQQKSVVGGDREATHARVAEQLPGRPPPLDGLVKERWTYALLPGIVDLEARYHHQPRPGHGLFQARFAAGQTSSRVSQGAVPPPTRPCMAFLRSSGRRPQARRRRNRGPSPSTMTASSRRMATGARAFMPTAVTVGSSARRASRRIVWPGSRQAADTTPRPSRTQRIDQEQGRGPRRRRQRLHDLAEERALLVASARGGSPWTDRAR